ncbi:uncharacterized protein LOC106177409 [Lingula anatina]|uniref:Uncharacterized protein LOC106177409 n=1 Tax=Lingula anatina TaxID=7574 RepID=A0A1S3K020_LINAN|nr:uncharacterized protein LOC106177409 [Lingula anatina]|eukprot:XP_013415621.1 uncharacterized protein LOC106177409 [Lingula anatina]
MFPYPSQQHASGYYHPTSSDATSNSNQYFLPPCSSPQSRSLQQYLPALPQAPVGQYHQGSWAHTGAAVQASVVAPIVPSPAMNYAIPAEAATQGATLFYGQYPVVPCSQTLDSSGYLPSNSNSGATLGTWSVSGCPVEPYLLHLTSPPPKQAVKTEQLGRERLYTRQGNVTPTLIQKQEQMPRPTGAQVCKTALEPIPEYAETKPDLSEKLFWKFLEVLKTYGPQEVNSEKLLNVFMNLSPHERRFIMSHGTLKEFLSTFPSLYLENGFLYLRQRGAPAEDKTISGSEKITKEETVGNINENCKNDLIEIPMHDRDSLDEIDDRDCIIPESLQQKSVFEDIARTHGISIGTAQECTSKTFPTTEESVKDQTCDSSQAVLDHIDKECVRKTTEIPCSELVQQTKYAYSEDVWKPKGIVNPKISKGCTKSKMLRIECLNHALTGNSDHSEAYHNDHIIPYTAKDTLSTKNDAPADIKLTEVMNKTQELENVSTTNQICSGMPVQHFDGKQDLPDFADLEFVIEAYEMGMKYCQKNTKDALLIAAKQLVLETLVSTKENMKFTDRKLLDDKTPTKDEVHPMKTTGSQSVFSHDSGFKDQNATFSSPDIDSDTSDMAVSQEPQLKLPAPSAETYLSPSRLKATAPEFKLKPSPLSPGGGTASLVAGDPKIISSKSETSSPSRLRPAAQEFKFKPLVSSSVPSIGGSPSRLKATVSEFVPRFKQPALSKIPDILSVQHQEQQTDHPSCYQKETGTSPRRLKTKEFSAQSAVDVAEVMINTEECLFSEESTYYVEPCQTARKSTNTEISGRIRAEPRMLSRYTSTESGSVVDRKIFDNAVTQLIAAEIKVLQLQFYLCSERLLNWFEDWKKLQNLDSFSRYDQHVMDTLNTGKQNVGEELKRMQALYETNVRELCKGVPLESLTALKVNLPTTQGPNKFSPREVDYNKIVKAFLEHYCPNDCVDPEVIVLNERSWDRFMTKEYKKEAQKGHAAAMPEVPLPVNPDLTPDPLTFAGNVQNEVPTVGVTSSVNQLQLPKSQIAGGASSAVGQQSDKVVSSSLQAETVLPCGDNPKGFDVIAKIQLSNDDEEKRTLLRIPTKCPPGLSNIQEPIIKKAFKPLGRRALKPRKNKVAEPKVLVSSAFETSASGHNQSNKLGNSIILSETYSKLPDMDDGISESSTLTSEEVAMPFKADLLQDAKASEMQMTTSTINVSSSQCDEMAPQKTTLGLPAVTTDLSQQQQVPQVNPVAYQYVVSQLLQMNPQLIENPAALQYIAVQQLITMQQLQTGMLATTTYGGQSDPSTLATAGLGTHSHLTALATAAYGTQSDLASLAAAVYGTQSDTATLAKAAGFGVQNDPSTVAFSAQNGTMNFDTFSGLSTLAKVSPGTQNDRKSMSHVKSVTLDQSNFVIPQAGQGDESAGPGKAIASVSPDQQKRCFPLTGESQDKLATKEAQGDMPPYHRGAVQHSTLEVEKASSSERCHVDCSKPFPDAKSFLMNDASDSGSNESKSILSLARGNYTSRQSAPLRYAAENLATTVMNQTYVHDKASGFTKEYQGQLDRDRQSSISSSEGASFSRSSLSFQTAKSPFSEQSCYESVPTSPRAATSAESNSSEYSTSTSSLPQTPRDPQNVKGSLSQESLVAGFGLLEQGAGEWKTVGSKGREQKVELSGGQNRPSVWQTTSSTSVRTTAIPPGWNTTVSKSQSGLAISDIPPRFRAKRASESEASVERVSPVGAGGPAGGNTGQGKSQQRGKQPSIQSTGRSTPVMSISGQPLPIVQSSISNVTVNTVGASGSISNMKADKVETAKIQPYVVPGTPSSRPSSHNSEMDSIQLADSHIGNEQVEDSDEWQQVSKKKKKPDVLQEHLSSKPLQTTGSTKASNFERLIGRLLEKFPKLTRAKFYFHYNYFLHVQVDYNKIVKAFLEHYCPNDCVDPEVIVLNERSWDRFMTKEYKKEAQKGHAAAMPEVPLPVNPDLTPDPLTFAGNVQNEVPTVGVTSSVNQLQLPKSQIAGGASSAVGQQSDKVVSSSLQAETVLPCGVMQSTGDNPKGLDVIAKIQLSNDDEEKRTLLRIPTKCPPGLSNIQEPIIKKAFKPLGRRALKPRKNKVAEPKVLVSSAFETSASSHNQSNKLGNSIILSETNSKLPDMDDGISESSTLTSEEVAMPFKADLLQDAKASEMQMTTSTINVSSSQCDEMAPQKTTLGLPAVTTDLSQQQQVPQVNPVAYQYVVSQLLQMNPQLIENPAALQYIAVQQLITMQQLQTGMLATTTYGGQCDPSTLATAGLGTHSHLTALATAAYGTQSDLASLAAAVYGTQSDTATLAKAAGFGVQNDPSTVAFSAQNGTMNFDTFSGLSTLAKVPPGTQNDRKSMSHVKSVTLDQSNFVIPQAGQGDESAGPGKAIASVSPDQQKRCFPLTGESQDKLATKEAQGDMPPYHRGAVQHSTLEVEKTSSSERCHVDCSKPFPDVKSFLMNDASDSGSNESKSILSLARGNYTSRQSAPLRYAAENLATTVMNQTYVHDKASGFTKEYQGQLDRDGQSSISSSEGASFSRSSLSFQTAKSPFSEQSCYESVPTSPRAATSAESNSSEYSTSTSSLPRTPRDPQNVKGSLSQESLVAGFGLLEQGAGEWKTVGSKGREQKVDLSGGQNRPSVWQTTSSTSVRTTANPPGWNTTVSKSQSGLAISDIPPRFRAKRTSESEASVERVSPVGAGGPAGGNTGQGKSQQRGKQPSIQSTGRSTPVMSISGQPLPIVQSSISNVTVNTVGASGSLSNMKADKVETAKIQPYVVPGTPSSRPSSRNSEMDSIQLADSHIGNEQVEDSDEWQQVSKKKKKPDVLQEHLSSKPLQTTGSTKASNFERLIGRLLEKFPKLTRADTINLLKELRTRHGGLQGIGLAQILDEAEVVVKEWQKKPERTFDSSNKAIEKEMVWQAKYKTEICMEWLTSGKCKMGSKCNFAHGQQEVRGMQKTEMCKYFLSKAGCPYSKCIFAHDQSELCSQLPKKSVPTKAPQNVVLLSDDEDDDDDDDDSYEQCVICCSSVRNPQSEKRLECGHTFHDKCISRWVLGEERTCPTCRSLALLPEEFPRLSKQ